MSGSATPLSERWFRSNPDSSVLDRPRLLTRSLIDLTDLDDQIAFYERLLGVPADLRMPIPDFGGLELAAVGTILLIASEQAFTPVQRQTAYSLIVPSLTAQLDLLERTGTAVLEHPEAIVPGSRARVRYPDGSLAELVEHRPQPGERPAPRPGIAVSEARDTGIRLLARRTVPAAKLDDTTRFYETALETEAEARITLRSPDSACISELAIVSNLLLVGSDELAYEDDPCVAFAVLTSSIEQVAALGSVDDHSSSMTDGRTVVTLASGVSAEVWDGLPVGLL